MKDEQLKVSVVADTTGFETALAALEKQALSFGTVLTGALKSAIISGKSLEDVLRGIASSMATTALNAGLQPLQGLLNGFASRIASSILPVTPFAAGGVPSQPGAVFRSPAFFPTGRGLGLLGEAGPEAVLPLSRTSDGRLGVATEGQRSPAPVTVHIHASDVESFRRTAPQISAELARAVRRGQKSL